MSRMTRTEELLALAEAATQGTWNAEPVIEEHDLTMVCSDNSFIADQLYVNDAEFIATANPETIKQLIELVRLQHEALKDIPESWRAPFQDEAIEAFNKLEGGE